MNTQPAAPTRRPRLRAPPESKEHYHDPLSKRFPRGQRVRTHRQAEPVPSRMLMQWHCIPSSEQCANSVCAIIPRVLGSVSVLGVEAALCLHDDDEGEHGGPAAAPTRTARKASFINLGTREELKPRETIACGCLGWRTQTRRVGGGPTQNRIPQRLLFCAPTVCAIRAGRAVC